MLGRYRLIERLGAGGFGVVWRAHDEMLDREVALKRISLPSEEDRERATREALATARLAHPAIVALYEATSDEDAFYLISELVEGDTLAGLIAGDELCDEDVLEIGIALTGALRHAHARGVIHRDVKPQNVLVPLGEADSTQAPRGSAGAAKLADFGGARLAGEDVLTRAGDVLGTLAYMAPEQSEGHEAGVEADLYSLALVLYEAFSGVNPVRGRSPAATARRIGAQIEPLERRRRDLPRELTRALDVALEPDPDDRGTLAELQEALEDALEPGPRRRLLPRRGTSRRPAPGPVPAQTAGDSLAAERGRIVPSSPHTPHRSVQASTRHVSGSEPGNGPDERPVPRRTRIALPRHIWLGCALAVVLWQAVTGRPGVSLLLLAAAAPLVGLPRRSGPGWAMAALAPALGLAGLALAFPALAGQRSRWRARAAIAALGFWWIALAEPLLGRRLWEGPPAGVPSRAVWESSLTNAASHVVASTLTVELALGTVAWALAAVVLPWIVRGRSAALDMTAAVAWMVALLAAVPLLDRALLPHTSFPTPSGALLGASVGAVLAVSARALRGPV